MKTTAFLFIWGIISISQIAFGQEVISSAGEEYNSSELSLSFTIGEFAVETYTETSFILTQGFHQPILNLSTGLAINALTGVSVFPVPTSNLLNIVFESLDGKNTYQLYNIQGKLLNNGVITNLNTVIKMDEYASGTYILFLENPTNKKFTTFKIIKE